ncbi:unnamed protein product, partial [Staurois parvus]
MHILQPITNLKLYLDGCVLIKIVSGPSRYRLLFLGNACTKNLHTNG